MEQRKQPVPQEVALASDVFDKFCSSSTLKAILGHHRQLCELLHVKPTVFPHFYPKLKAKLHSWKAQALWAKFDKRASHKCYNRGKACPNTRVLIIGAGPCGLRTGIEAQLLGAKVVIVEKRDRISRNNVLHLWPFVIQDLRALGAKKFFGKFCAGSIDHISIRQLQCILLKVALILGVEIHEGVNFKRLVPPPDEQSHEKIGWRAEVTPADHPVTQYEFDVLIGADGKRNTLDGFKRKEFRGKLAIAVTANFINRRTEAEARVEEISGVAFIFNQKFFKDLYAATGIDLENIVYYKDDTHYFVMTAKKHSLIDKGVILQDYADTAKLLASENVDKDALQMYAREAADFSTEYMLPQLEFAVNHYGQPDVAMFDFTSMFAAENASRVMERHGHKLLQILVGDSLLEPFWPTGSGCARGFLSSLDACWAVKSWGSGQATPLDVLAERESIYRLLGQTTPENLHRDTTSYTLDPHTRYPNLNTRCVLPFQVQGLYTTDDPTSVQQCLVSAAAQEMPKKRRRKVKDSQVHPDALLHWLKKQVALYDSLHVEDVTHSFKNGLVLCAIIHRYRPDLLDFHTLSAEDIAANNQLAFDTLERELGIPPVMTGQEMEQCDVPDKLTMLSYLSQIYDTFRGEIPHIKHPKLEDPELKEDHSPPSRTAQFHSRTPAQKMSLLGHITSQQHHHTRTVHVRKPVAVSSPAVAAADRKADLLRRQRKRRSTEKDRIGSLERPANIMDHEARMLVEAHKGAVDKDFSGRIKTLEEKLKGTAVEKKPKDLRRAIGKIEKTDWNVREIEKKILENKMGHGVKRERPEKVPKWSREQFDDKFQAVKSKLQRKSHDQQSPNKYADVDASFKQLDRKLRDGRIMQVGPRGSNKVSAIAEQLSGRKQEPEKPTVQRSNSKTAVFQPAQGGSECCHFCGKRVYLMERLSAEGRFFHRGCFRCEYCNTTLRLGNYAFDREGKFGSRFYCTQHFGLQGMQRMKLRRKSDELRSGLDKENIPAKMSPKTPDKAKSLSETVGRVSLDVTDSKATPERIEFENLTAAASDVEEAPSEMDEDEWTDRNFGASAVEGSTDSLSDLSDSEEEENEVFEEAVEQPLTLDETRRLAETWTRRYSKTTEDKQNGDDQRERQEGEDEDEDEDSESYEYEETDEDLSCPEYESDGEESETATEGEDEIRARELRKQEVHLTVPERPQGRQDTDTGSDTEVGSDEYTTESESEEEVEENSATEIETDSEFEHDGTTPTQHDVPAILIDDSNITYRRGRRVTEEPKKVQVRTGHILHAVNGTVLKAPAMQQQARGGVRLEFSPLQPETQSGGKSARVTNVNAENTAVRTPPVVKPTPLINPRRGDYLLNRTHSTEGIASKMSLELKKKYLLGASGLAGSVRKSGSASTLDSKFKSFVDMISEHQKLLNPAPEPSPTMQAFLQGAAKLHASHAGNPLSPPSPTILSPAMKVSPSLSQQPALSSKQKQLPPVGDGFQHVCGLGKREEETEILSVEDSDRHAADNLTGDKLDVSDVVATVDKCRMSNLSDAETEKMNVLLEQTVPDVISEQNGTPSLDVDSKLVADVHTSAPTGAEQQPDVHTSAPSGAEQQPDVHTSAPSGTEQQPDEESDYRPRSPVHETSIIVPQIPWKTVLNDAGSVADGDGGDGGSGGGSGGGDDDDDITSDSLVSDSSGSDLEGGEVDHNSKLLSFGTVGELTPPRVEIHDSGGKLLAEPAVEERPKTSVNGEDFVAPSGSVVPLHIEAVNLVNRIAEVHSKSTETPVSEHRSSSFTSGRSSPSTPPSTRGEDSESYHNEATLADTELSDWAQDADAVVSEDLEDVEFNIDPQYVTLRRHRKPKTIKRSSSGSSVPARIARSEDFDFEDDPGHVCGINKRITGARELGEDVPLDATLQILTNMDNIEFMDTGEEESGPDDVLSATNQTLVHNSGYIQFVSSVEDEDLSTPVVETPTVAHEMVPAAVLPSIILSECERDSDSLEATDVLSQTEMVNKELVLASAGEDEENSVQPEGTTTEETTTSEVITVKDSPGDVPQTETSHRDEVFYTPQQECTKSADGTPVQPVTAPDDTTGAAYEEYVHCLQNHISPFSNVRDSIDVRKSRRRNKGIAQKPRMQELIAEGGGSTSALPVGSSFNSPDTSRKLEAISRERSKQKDLVHEMVMDKLLAQKKSPQERKSKRLSRGSFNSTQLQTTQPDTRVICDAVNSGSHQEIAQIPGDEKTVIETKTDVDIFLPSPLVTTKTDSEERRDVRQDMKVPSAESSTPAGEQTEQFYTPMTSFKVHPRCSHLRQRPLSIHSSFRSGECAEGSVSERNSSCLPATPLTNPEAFSLPDIRKALFNTSLDMLKTPVAPAQMRQEATKHTAERERVREQARIRAQHKTDEELGLSPEDYIKMLRQKVAKQHTSGAGLSTKRHGILRSLSEPGKELKKEARRSGSSIEDEPPPHGSAECLSSAAVAVSRLSPSPVESCFSHYQQLQSSPSEGTSGAASPSSAPLSKERVPLVPGDMQSKSGSESSSKHLELISTSDGSPPPVPPPPLNYDGGHIRTVSEDSYSEPEENSRGTVLSTSTHNTTSIDGVTDGQNRRLSRMNRRVARQTQLKRLRMAQEIQRQLEELEVKQRELEQRGVTIEKALRGEGADAECKEEPELLREWFDLMRERTELRHYERELMVRAQEMELEDRHARLRQELQERMSRDDSSKSSEDVVKEGEILREILEIVEQRDSLIALLEEDRQRYQEEDKDLEAQMLAKGLRLTPLRQESHV